MRCIGAGGGLEPWVSMLIFLSIQTCSVAYLQTPARNPLHLL